MKKIIFTLLLSIITLGVSAQEITEYEKDTRELVALVYKTSYITDVNEVGETVKQQFRNKFLGQGARQMNLLFNKYSGVYMTKYSHEEIKSKLAKAKRGEKEDLLLETEEIKKLELNWENVLKGTASKYNAS